MISSDALSIGGEEAGRAKAEETYGYTNLLTDSSCILSTSSMFSAEADLTEVCVETCA